MAAASIRYGMEGETEIKFITERDQMGAKLDLLDILKTVTPFLKFKLNTPTWYLWG